MCKGHNINRICYEGMSKGKEKVWLIQQIRQKTFRVATEQLSRIFKVNFSPAVNTKLLRNKQD